mmetsp:Transcript_13914/g.32136  ORF Transcript_13914/g.32136 Transcript_13914/m.32136 type:complete len:181 (-) Transcript_13914:48-590(-)
MAKLFSQHRKCISKLRMSVPRTVINGFIDKTKIKPEWPYGRLWIVFKRLNTYYYQDDLVVKQQLKLDMEMIVMFTEKEDPDAIFRRLENVQSKYARRPEVAPSCADLLSQLINGSQPAYQAMYARELAKIRKSKRTIVQEDIDEFQELANIFYATTIISQARKFKGKTNHSFKDSKGNKC